MRDLDPDGRRIAFTAQEAESEGMKRRREQMGEYAVEDGDYAMTHLWLVDVETGEARRLTDGRSSDSSPAWSPDGRCIAYVTNERRDWDLTWRSDVWVVEVDGGHRRRVTGGEGAFDAPAWLPDGTTLAVLGHRFPARAGSRNDVWLFPADGSDAGPAGGRNLSGRHDREPGATPLPCWCALPGSVEGSV